MNNQHVQWSTTLLDSLSQLFLTIKTYLPNLLGALFLLIIGYALAWSCRFLILRLAKGIDVLTEVIYKKLGMVYVPFRWPLSSIIASIAFWGIILFFLGTAFRALGWPGPGEFIRYFFPLIVVGLIILFVGYGIANAAQRYIIHMARAAQLEHAHALGGFIKFIVLFTASILAIQYLGLNISFFLQLTLLAISCILITLAIAFGFGATYWVKNVIMARSLHKVYNIGQRISIDDIEGHILDIQHYGVLIDTQQGKTRIPVLLFNEKISMDITQV